MGRATTFGLILFLLLGCTTPEQREEERQAQLKKDVALVHGICKNLGFEDYTDAMNLCVQTNYSNLLSERAYQQQQNLQFWYGVQQAGKALQGNTGQTYSCKKDFGFSETYSCDPKW